MARKGIWERLLQWTLSVREEWCECCLTAQERRRGVLKRLIGMSYVEHEDMPRYKTLQEESKKILLKADLPENHRILRLGQRKRATEDLERLSIVLDGDGVVDQAFYG